ncbi:MAG: hypothetical protein KatS3mg097_262 [Candidatus Parcubacteria bacterium]|nr:MAG: hypothetical protein KatS3mg097_262 [Candidatus Parcubacteria bacterium]
MVLKSKGLTLLEIVIVVFILLIILTFFFSVFDYANFFKKSRDDKRIADLWALEMALTSYLMFNKNNPLALGPTNTGIGESEQSIFISVPVDVENLSALILGGYRLKQASSSNLINIDGNGWLPVDLTTLVNPPLVAYPVDPINSYNKKLFYAYVFKRNSSTFEINANLEFSDYKKNGGIDQTSYDSGDNDNVLEVGNDKRLMINLLY